MRRSFRTRPPSSSCTGTPSCLPLMSHSAMSIALATWAAAPLLPMYVKARNTLCQVSSMREGSSPTSRSLTRRTMAATAVRHAGGRRDLAPPGHALVGAHLHEEVLAPEGAGSPHE